MSYDLMAFEMSEAPQDKKEFLNWYLEQTNWQKNNNDISLASPNLQAFYREISKTFPPMNGSGSPNTEELENNPELEDLLADYSIGKNVIYIGFSWEKERTAYNLTKKLCEKHQVGFFDPERKKLVFFSQDTEQNHFPETDTPVNGHTEFPQDTAEEKQPHAEEKPLSRGENAPSTSRAEKTGIKTVLSQTDDGEIQKAFEFSNDASHKFWRIETLGSKFAVTYGKIDTFGKYETKEWESPEECRKQAAKLCKSKTAKGYTEIQDFDFRKLYRFDDAERGPDMITSHPEFRQYFGDSGIYCNTENEDCPFGNDTGKSILRFLEEKIRKDKRADFSNLYFLLAESESIPEAALHCGLADAQALPKECEKMRNNPEYAENARLYDRAVIALALAQMKITGKINRYLLESALLSLQRLSTSAQTADENKPEAQNQIYKDLLTLREAYKQKDEQLNRENEEKTKNFSEPAKLFAKFFDCGYIYFPRGSDCSEIINAFEENVREGKEKNYFPVIVTADENLLSMFLYNSGGGEDGNDLDNIREYREAMIHSRLPEGEKALAKLIRTRKQEAKDDDTEWEEIIGEFTESEDGENNSIEGFLNPLSNQAEELFIVKIPVKNPWEIFAWLPMGNWNECPDTEILMSTAKYWYEKFGAVPVSMTHDTLEFRTETPIADEETAMETAVEMYGYCPDIEQTTDSIGEYAGSLINSRVWFFWWD